MTRKPLSRDGIIAIGCPGALGYLDPELRRLNAMIFHTLKKVFPLGLFYGLLYWNALFSPEMGTLLAVSAQIRVWHLVLPIAAGTLLAWGIVKRTRRGRKAIVPIVIVTAGFVGMTADLLIWPVQVWGDCSPPN